MEASQAQIERFSARSTTHAVRRNGVRPHLRVASAPAPVRPLAASASDRACRALNVVAAAGLLALAAPLMLLIAALIKLTSRGPVLYVQHRVGLDRRNGGRPVGSCQRASDIGGRPFRMYKFRSMYVNGNGNAEVWARPDDPRVTPVGRVLRRYRLDELPQLINVLLGDMNVVGPRPEQPAIFQTLRDEIEGYERRQSVPPGITGWAQINHRYDTSVDDVRRKLDLDLEYIRKRSVAADLRILARTVPVVIFKQGAW